MLAEAVLQVSEPQHLALVTYPMSSTRYVALKPSLASLEVESLGFPSRLFQKEPGRVT